MTLKNSLAVLFFLFTVQFFSPASASATVLKCDGTDHATLDHRVFVTEFNPTATSGHFVELINTTDYNLNLSGCTLEVYSSVNSLLSTVDLAGTIPQTALLTNDLSSPVYDSAGGKLVLKEADGTALYSVSYGTYSGTQANDAGASLPTSAQSFLVDGHNSATWEIGSSTKGWCNPTGFGDCPNRSAVIADMTSHGVSTNLGEMTDWTRIVGMYFEMPQKGRIDFLSTINFTDRYSLDWLHSIGQNIDMATAGQIGLDADTIQGMVNTHATLTMYGLSLNNPTILVNNAADSNGIITGVVYNQATGTLTFDAAHFTTFTAVEASTSAPASSTSSSVPTAPLCTNVQPASIPDLFQINTSRKSAKLYFTPLSDTSQYYISFSTKPNAEDYGELVTLLREGVQSHSVYYLKPNTTYYVKVRGQNGCMPGNWSNIFKFKTTGRIFYRY
ncbi:MAG: hypothetical protein WC686_04815 [Candidatus Shapirobacteria bacterium]|jgi:hypothetical protein